MEKGGDIWSHMRSLGIKYNEVTDRYYIDTSFRLINGKTFHFKYKSKNGEFKKLKYVRENYYSIINAKREELNNAILINNEILNNAKQRKEQLNKNSLTKVSVLFEKYLDFRLNQIRKYTIKKYEQIVNNYIIKETNDDIKTFLNASFIIQFRKNVLSKDVSNNTKSVYFHVAKELITFARKISLINSDKRDDLLTLLDNNFGTEIKKPSKNKFTSLEEAHKIFSAAKNEYDKTLFILLYYSSLRIGEFLGIYIKDIKEVKDSNNNFYYEINIERQRYQSGEVVPYLKNGIANKTIYYFNEAALTLKKYLESNNFKDDDFLFDISRKTIERRFKTACSNAKVNQNTLHGFGRKSINTVLYINGADSKTRCTLLGQESESINEIHYIAQNEALAKARMYLKNLWKRLHKRKSVYPNCTGYTQSIDIIE